MWGLIAASALLAGCGGGGGGSAISVATPFDDPVRERQVASVYASAGRRDVASLLALKNTTVSPSPHQDPAVTLALYIINPSTYATDFVAAYPTDARGVMLDYGSRLDAAHLVPAGSRFPVKALAALAAKGNALALQKLLDAFAAAREPISGEYGREIAYVAALTPHEMLTAIAALPPGRQLDLTALSGWCGRQRPPLLSFTATNGQESAVQNQIRDRLTACPTPPPHKRRKPRRPRKSVGKQKHPHAHKAAPKRPRANRSAKAP